MAIVLKDRVKQTAAAPGAGTITLGSTPAGFQAFSAIGNGNVTYFAIVDNTSGAWEVNYGTYTSSGTTLSRNATPLSSSTGGTLVNFTNAVDVFVTYPSENAVWRDTSGVVAQQSFGAITATSAALTTGTVSTTPSSDIDIANKQYVDTVAAEGIHYHEAVFVESPDTAGNLTATYTTGGTNSNIIQIANGTDITFFGYTPVVGDQFLTTAGNGLLANTPYYIVALVGSACQISLTYGGAIVTGLTDGGVTLPSLINPGVGATLTNAGTQVALTIDGVLMTVGKRVLIYNQTNAFENGVYTVTTVGTGSTNWVLTRATDADTYSPSSSQALGQGDAFFVTNGDTGAGETYVVTTNGDIFFGITSITFAQISSTQVYNAGTGLTLSPATTFNIANTTVTAATYGSASAVPVFAVNAQGQLTSVTDTSIAINGSAVSGAISGQAGSVANALTLGTYLTGTSFNGSAAVTATVDATSANTASKVVARDVSGNFSAGTITAALTGNASTATAATNVAGGAANQIVFNTAASTTAFASAPSATGDLLNWTGSAFAWTQSPSITSITLSGGTANGVTYLNGSKVLTSGSALVFDGTNFTAPRTQVTTAGSPPAAGAGIELIGSTSPLILAYNRGTSAYISLNYTASAMQWNIGASAAMSLDASGNLGIGTTSPVSALTLANAKGLAWPNASGTFSGTAGAQIVKANDNNLYFDGYDGAMVFRRASFAESMRLDSAGNLGLGVTPSAWKSDQRVVQVGAASSIQSNAGVANSLLNSNVYFDSTGTLKYITTDFASRYVQYLGVHSWDIAASGTAGATISFTQAMTLNASGNLLVGGTAARATTAGTKHLDLFDGTAPAGTLTNGVSVYSSSGDLKFMDSAGNAYDVGFRNIPQNAQTGNYTLVLADSGKHIYHAVGAGAATYTIPANSSVAYVIGTALSFVNLSTTSISIAITTDTMYLGGTGTTGTRTLANYGTATALKVTSTVWIITGSGLT